MPSPVVLPIEGKSIRFAPSRDSKPAASIWKVWAEGNEIYASMRNLGGGSKLSVHRSGQIHYRLGAKEKIDLAPLMRLDDSPWRHAFELRFLLSNGTLVPIGQLESLKKGKRAHLIPVPDGSTLYANLIIGDSGISSDQSLPQHFIGGHSLWKARLRDDRLAVLVARLLSLDDLNRRHIEFIRGELKPTVTLSTLRPEPRYMEVLNLHSSENGGNVVLITPMGAEAFRSEQERPEVEGPLRRLRFCYQCSASTVDILAPDGRRAAVIGLEQYETQIALATGTTTTTAVGKVNVQLEPQNLVAGSPFIAVPSKLASKPTINAGSPRKWDYSVVARFDGSVLHLELRQISVSLQNRNLAVQISDLGESQELLMTIPSESLHLSVPLSEPLLSATLFGRFTLREHG